VKRTLETIALCLMAAVIAWVAASFTLKLAGECKPPHAAPASAKVHRLT
jgi:hypothetical protein